MAQKPTPTPLPARIRSIVTILTAARFNQLTGAHGFQQMNVDTLRFRLPSYVALRQINRVNITATAVPGVYQLTFGRKFKVDGKSVEQMVATVPDVAGGQILKCISEQTGLNTDPFIDLM
jgi:hypothetical protein